MRRRKRRLHCCTEHRSRRGAEHTGHDVMATTTTAIMATAALDIVLLPERLHCLHCWRCLPVQPAAQRTYFDLLRSRTFIHTYALLALLCALICREVAFQAATSLKTKNPRIPRGSLAGMPGLEPRMAEPESAVLPITPHPNLAWRSNSKELFVVPPTGFEPVLAP